MQILDWVIVLALNGAIVLWGLQIGRGTKSTADWFLAAKNLPWWIVGFSLFATAIDSGDYVAIMGGAYHLGISNVTMWWIGLPLGWFLVSYVVIVPIYRNGLYTNAEYLEYRFGPTARIMSAFIQLQQRTNVLGNVAFSLYLVFSTLTNWSDTATWFFVGGIALAAAVYTAVGGLRSVAITDSAQSVLMIIATLILFVVVWTEIGGWQGLEGRLSEKDPALVGTLMHVGGRNSEGVPAVLLLFGFIVSLSAYCVINQSQIMRMLAARSEWDLRTAALLASAVAVLVMGCNIFLGVLGHGLFPNLEHADRLYPLMLSKYLGVGLLGLVVSGLLAGAISTYDSVSSAVAAVLTRDVYARFIVKRGDDSHYLRVSRILTVLVIVVSFGYIPFLGQGMVMFYFRLATVAVIPLFTVYLMGVLTRVHRRSGTVGLIIGIGYGLSAFIGDQWGLPFMWTNTWWSYLWGILITSGAMVAASLVYGWETKENIAALLYKRSPDDSSSSTLGFDPTPSQAGTEELWLVTSRKKAAHADLQVDPEHIRVWYRQPALWFILLLIGVAYVNFVVLW